MKIQPFICFCAKDRLALPFNASILHHQKFVYFFAKPSIFTINSSKFPQNDESRRQGLFRSAIDFYKIKILLIRKLCFLRAGKPRVQKASVVQLKARFEACILVRRDEVLQKALYRCERKQKAPFFFGAKQRALRFKLQKDLLRGKQLFNGLLSSCTRPASIRDISKISLMSESRWSESSLTFSRYCIAGLSFSSLPSASVSMPMMPFIGVRISCDMRERNVVFDWLASSACIRRSS